MAPLLASLISGYRLRGGNMDNILGSSRRSVLAAGLAVSSSWLVGRSQAQTPESVMTRPIPHSGEQLPIVGLGTAVSAVGKRVAARRAQRRDRRACGRWR